MDRAGTDAFVGAPITTLAELEKRKSLFEPLSTLRGHLSPVNALTLSVEVDNTLAVYTGFVDLARFIKVE